MRLRFQDFLYVVLLLLVGAALSYSPLTCSGRALHRRAIWSIGFLAIYGRTTP